MAINSKLFKNGAYLQSSTTLFVFFASWGIWWSFFSSWLDKSLGLNGGQIAQAVNQGLRDIDAVSSTMGSARAAAGETLNRIDGIENRIDAQTLSAKTSKSNAVDLDMVSAISDFQTQQTAYDAALKTYSLVQKLSLFQYISG